MVESTFIGFYMGEGFWVDRPIDFNDPQHDHRLSGIIPAIIMSYRDDAFELHVCVDGLLLLRINHLATAVPDMSNPSLLETSVLWWREHLDFANALQLLIESESRKCDESNDVDAMALSMEETCRVCLSDGRALSRTANRGRNLLTVRSETLDWIGGGRRGDRPTELCDTAWWVWGRVALGAISKAVARFRTTVDHRDRVKLLSMIVQAKTAHSEGHYATAFVLFWFAIESSVQSIASVSQGSARTPKVHEAVDQLLAAGLIDADLAHELHSLRQLRNAIMHQPGRAICTPSDSGRAAQAAVTISTFKSGLDLVMGWQTTVQF